ncbi:thioredoxin family protein [Synechococcus sp. BDU 130192]|uniref:thioredoxin family protein n=1 Tax=Synechococcus sp. BDU 130192 TaxID=2042059 RepID=UPI000C083F7B|nr:thioredoxin domain-containing protein [Synechococcus sp. BDU 130192]
MAVKKQFSSFEAMLQAAEKPILVDFYATWCGPCQIMGKTLEEISPQMANEIQIVKVDGDRYPALASHHGVHAYPTLVLYNKGQLVSRIEGAVAAPQLMQQIRRALQN